MTEWEPATDAEVAMRNALRTDDQESYFRILAGVDLLLPVSADALAGLAPLGWGTWSTGGRTHVLAFTSPSALQACLADYTGSARRVAYAELAETWPNLEWWLAVNPGLPIEGYLPAWFVAQLSRGDLRLPTRGPGREGSNAPNRIQDLHAAAAMAAKAAAQGYAAQGHPAQGHPAQGYAAPGSGGPMPGDPVSGVPGSGGPGPDDPVSGVPVSGSAVSGGPVSGVPAVPGSSSSVPGHGGSAAASAADVAPGGQVGPGGLPLRTPGAVLPSGLPSRVPGTPPGPGGRQGGGIPGGQFNGFGVSPGDRPVEPGGFAGQPGDRDGLEAQPRGLAGEPGADVEARPSPGVSGQGGTAAGVPAAYRPPSVPPGEASSGAGPGGAASSPSGLADRPGTSSSSALEALSARSGSGGASALNALGSRSGPATASGFGGMQDRGAPGGEAGSPPAPQRPDSPLPTRTPMAQTPPLPAHITPPDADAPQSPAAQSQRSATATPNAPGQTSPDRTPPGKEAPGQAAQDQAASNQGAAGKPARGRPVTDKDAAEQGGAPGGLPRRQVTSPDGRPPSMATAAQSLAGTHSPATSQPPGSPATSQPPGSPATSQPPGSTQASATTQSPAGNPPRPQPGLAPPVIPGAGGPARSSSGSAQPAPAVRPTVPPTPQSPSRAEQAATGAAPPHTGRPETGRPETGRARESDAGTGLPAGQEAGRDEDDFVPANEVERDLFHAVDEGSTDAFLSTLLLSTVLVPVAHNSRPGSAPGESGFAFRTEEIDGERFLVVFTSRDRLAEHFAEPTRTVGVRFVELIRNWPDPAWSFAVNPTSVIGAKYPGPQVIALASWAVEAGLGGDPGDAPVEPSAAPQRPAETSAQLTTMQKAVPAEQVDYYLERGYDRAAGFVHRAGEVEHLRTPGELFAALGLLYDGSPYQPDAKEAFVLRWPAYRPSLYRIPYGGQSEQALRAMDGWVIERPPFRGNGFAPGEGKDVIAEFKVDSVRLPHGTQLWRMDADGDERMIAIFDCDAPVWRRVGEQ